ncbi:hypothetical protein [Oceanicaulis sp.]|uniref:hypothetical protein n=1 Tax=Oceanicaulis sp. TaxID=1924941 RepID=UPI003BAAA27D
MGDAGRLQRKYPEYFLEAGKRAEIDITRVVQARAIYSQAKLEGGPFQRFSGTYRGNVAQYLLNSLTNEMVAGLSRLFAPVSSKRPLKERDRSLCLSAYALKNDAKLIEIFKRNARRWGASGEYSLTENGVVRQMGFAETLRNRIKGARAQERIVMLDVQEAVAEVERFSVSEAYGRVRSYRSERLSHSLLKSSDRRKYRIPEDYSLTYGDLIDAVDEGILVADIAYGAFYRTSLGLEDLSQIWSQYALEFWHAAAEQELPQLDFSDVLRS